MAPAVGDEVANATVVVAASAVGAAGLLLRRPLVAAVAPGILGVYAWRLIRGAVS